MKSKAPKRPFSVQAYLDSAGVSKKIKAYRKGGVVYSQGDPANTVMFIKEGVVKLTTVSEAGKEAVVAILGTGDFFGEGCMAGHTVRLGSATAIGACSIIDIGKEEMIRVLHREHALSDHFIAYMLSRIIRVEADLVDQLFNSSEKRLARTLLLLSRYGKDESPQKKVPKVSQEMLAEMIGSTRSRVNFFMNKFRQLGFIEYGGDGLHVNSSLLSVVLHE
ncbi:MAG: Crp/Fnr family transcriptional regulator [Acidipila sp.]|nr:Crp/Fnr family transcriptional regulator [Acidipila sp.]